MIELDERSRALVAEVRELIAANAGRCAAEFDRPLRRR